MRPEHTVKLTVRRQANSKLRDQSRSACEYNAGGLRKKQFGLKIRDKLTETHNAIIQIREVRRQLKIC